MDDMLGALEIEWMKREAERMDRQIREMLKLSQCDEEGSNETQISRNETRNN
jgi:hypothetical protein